MTGAGSSSVPTYKAGLFTQAPREMYPESVCWNCSSSGDGKAEVPERFLLLLLLTFIVSAFIELTFIPEGRGGNGL